MKTQLLTGCQLSGEPDNCILLIVFVSPPLPQSPTPAPNIIARKFCILHFHCLILVTCICIWLKSPPPQPPTPVQNIVCKGTDSPDFYLMLLIWWRVSFVLSSPHTGINNFVPSSKRGRYAQG